MRLPDGRNEATRQAVHGSVPCLRTDVIDAAVAYYVEGSPAHFCGHASVREDRSGGQYEVAWDRCLPSLIAFSSRQAALKFQEENGGNIKTYEELLADHS
ncbi:MAG: hypothetical protein E2P02_08080 [Acidobacteria bacterium]|nr:MAG: hypothetical protein E2P02_08080 [Acidobacteriota bacterium]